MIDYDPDAYADEPRSGAWRRTLYKVALSIAVLGGFAAAVVFAYSGKPARYLRGSNATTAPLVTADKAPVKVKPQDPGGAKVPLRESEIYRRLEGARRTDRPAARDGRRSSRRPSAKSQFSENLIAPGAGSSKRGRRTDDGDVDARPRLRSRYRSTKHQVVARGPSCTAPGPKGDRALQAKLSRAGVTFNRIAPGGGVVTDRRGHAASRLRRRSHSAAEIIGPYRVQLGAYRSAIKAQHQWNILVRRNKDLLGKLNMVIERVHLGPKGVVYRLQAGPLKTEGAARRLCRSLGRRRIGCILVSS